MGVMRVLLITPPMVQFNTPFAATPLLTAYLRREGIAAVQADLSLELALRLFSRQGLQELLDHVRRSHQRRTPPVAAFVANAMRYLDTVDETIRYLQTGDAALARNIAAGALPEGPRFQMLDALRARGMDPATNDPASYPRLLASLYLDDLADALRDGLDPRFGLSRYADHLAAAVPSFTPLLRALRAPPSPVDRMLDTLTTGLLEQHRPDVVAITIPFPGNVYGAFRIARLARAWNPALHTVAGGGFVNTELRALADPRVFDDFHFITYDDGEQPFLRLLQHIAGQAPRESLIRTRLRDAGKVIYINAEAPHLRHRERPAPCFDGLPLARYVGVAETINPMSRLWTERRWMKLTLAHGCYWRRCAFCDTTLDYIGRYDPADENTIVDWIEAVCRETGETGFHFVDEAAPPSLLGRMAKELIRRRLAITWWTNIRFEKAFTPELTALLARSGCVAVAGGLECAEARLLAAMDKGVTPPQAARVIHAFAQAGILVHAYLMFGFPRQTLQDTVDALEYVRQLFANGCLKSAFWHRFALTVHSPIFRDPQRFGVHVAPRKTPRFTENEVAFTDGSRTDHGLLGDALHRAVYNFMHGIGLKEDVRVWFDRRMPRPRLGPRAVSTWLKSPQKPSLIILSHGGRGCAEPRSADELSAPDCKAHKNLP